MNVCIVSTFSCDFEEFKELFDLSNQVIGEWCSEAELIKVNDHKSIMLVDVTDLDKMKEFMSAPEMLECCLLYTSPSPRDATLSRMPSSA